MGKENKKTVESEMNDKNILLEEKSFYDLYNFRKLKYKEQLSDTQFEIILSGRQLVDLWNAVNEFKTEHKSILPSYYIQDPINTILDTINDLFRAKQIGVIDNENEARKARILELANKLAYEVENLGKIKNYKR